MGSALHLWAIATSPLRLRSNSVQNSLRMRAQNDLRRAASCTWPSIAEHLGQAVHQAAASQMPRRGRRAVSRMAVSWILAKQCSAGMSCRVATLRKRPMRENVANSIETLT